MSARVNPRSLIEAVQPLRNAALRARRWRRVVVGVRVRGVVELRRRIQQGGGHDERVERLRERRQPEGPRAVRCRCGRGLGRGGLSGGAGLGGDLGDEGVDALGGGVDAVVLEVLLAERGDLRGVVLEELEEELGGGPRGLLGGHEDVEHGQAADGEVEPAHGVLQRREAAGLICC